ncbi:hypothetical protein chiPu_0033668, partial [Chiloscyllium punctatum]|nr:hypothetical protein [Chiloscyllium punctatum]
MASRCALSTHWEIGGEGSASRPAWRRLSACRQIWASQPALPPPACRQALRRPACPASQLRHP